jgi:predicted permease
MEVFAPLYPVVPVFVLIAVGFIFARCKKISLIPITELIVYLGTPSLVFTSLASKPILLNEIVILASGVLLIFAGVGLLIRLYFSLFRFSSPEFASCSPKSMARIRTSRRPSLLSALFFLSYPSRECSG